MIMDNVTRDKLRLELLGNKLSINLPVTGPFRELGDGSYADVFDDKDGKIIRVSEVPEDHNFGVLSEHVSWMPKLDYSVRLPKISVSIRDNHLDATNVFSGITKHLPYDHNKVAEYPVFGEISFEDDFHICRFLNEIVSEGVNPVLFRNAIAGIIDAGKELIKCANIKKYRQHITNIYRNTLHTMPKDYDWTNYILGGFSSISVNPETGEVTNDDLKSFRLVSCEHLLAHYVGIAELVFLNPDEWDVYHQLLKLCVDFVDDTGYLPYDIRYNNLGVRHGKLVFRDPYYIATKYPDYQIRIGKHRRERGLSVPDEWQVNPTRLDVITAKISAATVSEFRDMLGVPHEDNDDSINVVRDHKGNLLIESDKNFLLGTPALKKIKAQIAEYIPTDETGWMIDCTQEMVNDVFSAMGYEGLSQDELIVKGSLYVQSAECSIKDLMMISCVNFVSWMIETINKNGYSPALASEFFQCAKTGKPMKTECEDQMINSFRNDWISSCQKGGLLNNSENAQIFDLMQTYFELTGGYLSSESFHTGEDGLVVVRCVKMCDTTTQQIIFDRLGINHNPEDDWVPVHCLESSNLHMRM